MNTNKPINLPSGKIAALDLGDQWVGIALSDITRTLARPFTTVTFHEYLPAIKKFIEEQKPAAIVIGYPKTMRGTESDQTKKVVATYEELQKLFPETVFVLWDERLSSKRAQTASPARTKKKN